MSESCKTVRIKSDVPDHQPAGFVVINEADFDPEAHQLFDQDEPQQKPKKQPKAAPAAGAQE